MHDVHTADSTQSSRLLPAPNLDDRQRAPFALGLVQGSISLLQKDTMFMVAAQNFSEGDQMGFPFVIFDRSGTGRHCEAVCSSECLQMREPSS